MLKRIHDEQQAICAALLPQPQHIRALLPDRNEWDTINMVLDLLKPFYNATRFMSTGRYKHLRQETRLGFAVSEEAINGNQESLCSNLVRCRTWFAWRNNNRHVHIDHLIRGTIYYRDTRMDPMEILVEPHVQILVPPIPQPQNAPNANIMSRLQHKRSSVSNSLLCSQWCVLEKCNLYAEIHPGTVDTKETWSLNFWTYQLKVELLCVNHCLH